MQTTTTPPIHTRRSFLLKLGRNIIVGSVVIFLCLFAGMVGYHHYESMNWTDSYVNAAMILSGMGPISTLQTDDGKIFAGTYALFSGIFFLVIIAIMGAPIFHHFFHMLHIEEGKLK